MRLLYYIFREIKNDAICFNTVSPFRKIMATLTAVNTLLGHCQRVKDRSQIVNVYVDVVVHFEDAIDLGAKGVEPMEEAGHFDGQVDVCVHHVDLQNVTVFLTFIFHFLLDDTIVRLSYDETESHKIQRIFRVELILEMSEPRTTNAGASFKVVGTRNDGNKEAATNRVSN